MSEFEKFMVLVSSYLVGLRPTWNRHAELIEARSFQPMFDHTGIHFNVEQMAWAFAEYHSGLGTVPRPNWMPQEVEKEPQEVEKEPQEVDDYLGKGS